MKRLIGALLICLFPAAICRAQEEPKKPETQVPAQEAQPAEPLPALDDILAKLVENSGGEAAILKINSRHTKGTFDIPAMGANGTFDSYAKAPDKSLTVIDVPGFGVIQMGYDGTVAWEDNPMVGMRELAGSELAARKRDADFRRELHMKELYPQMTVKAKEKVGERPAYLVEAVPAEGKPEKLYFDAETGLLVRADAERENPQGVALVESYFEDYRDIDGVKLPFAVRQVTPMFELTLKFNEVRHNVEIDDAKFAKPEPPKEPAKEPAKAPAQEPPK